MPRPVRPTALALSLAAAVALGGGALAAPLASAAPGDGVTRPGHGMGHTFDRVATYPVYQNLPAGADRNQESVAEISAVTPDGRTVVYTDAPGGRVGIVDISDPAHPKGRGVIDLRIAGENVEPTSVAIKGEYLLVVIDTSSSKSTPSGRLDVYRIADRTKVRSIDLGGQPDSIALTTDARRGIVAIENERDEEAAPAGGQKGDLPQMPAGFVQVLDLAGAPSAWTATKVPFTAPDGSALPAFAGLDTPIDPEPEYVSINSRGLAAVTLQENNGVALVDLATKKITRVFSTGTATVNGVDTKKDGLFDPTASVTAPREPDAVAWIDDTHLATADEGDWKGGTRGWTIFDASGTVVWDAGNTVEELFTAHGLHNEDRAGKKGVEMEGLAVATMHGRRYAFVGSERSNGVAVYDMTNPTTPVFVQILPTTPGPEGLLPVPQRGLFITSSEVDDAENQVRASLGVYRLAGGRPGFPSIVSATQNGHAIGWGALSGLTLTGKNRLAAVSDSAYATGRIYDITAATSPATITGVTTVTEKGKAVAGLDLEGIAATKDGYWLASEGKKGAENQLLRVDRAGVVQQRVSLPTEVTNHIGKWGLEGVAVTGRGKDETLTVALQRPLFTDPAKATGLVDGQGTGGGVARIGRYHVATGTWEWFGYPLASTSTDGDWIGLSEISHVRGNTFAVVERDKLAGPAAAVKRITYVTLPSTPAQGLTMLDPRLAADLLPALRSTDGWTQEKVEGMAVDGKHAWVVTDNDALKDATGETVFFRTKLR